MDKHPDKYFSDRLGNFRQEPPAPAWDRIDANLSRTKAPNVWLRIAAGFLLLIAGVSLFLILQSTETEISFNEPNKIIPEISTNKFQAQSIDTNEQKPIVESHATNEITPAKEVVRVKNAVPKLKPAVEEELVTPIANLSADIVKPEVQSNSLSPSFAIAEEPEQPKVPSRVITYSAEEVNKKYLRIKKKESIVYSDPVKEKPTLREIASVIKHNTVGIGDLRQLKDDILSLELFAQNDKTKTQ